jgi:hypothetical protein
LEFSEDGDFSTERLLLLVDLLDFDGDLTLGSNVSCNVDLACESGGVRENGAWLSTFFF